MLHLVISFIVAANLLTSPTRTISRTGTCIHPTGAASRMRTKRSDGLGAQQKLTCSASEKCPRPGTRFRNQFEIVRHYPAKKITLIPRRAARAVKGARRAFILTLDSPSRPIESQRERSETKYSEASFRSCPVFSWWNASLTLHGLFVVDFTLGDRAVEGLECGRCGSSGGGDSRALRPWGGCPES